MEGISPTQVPGKRRRRRTPEEAEREIVEAAEALLRERPFREMTVDEVMRRTELSRPSFYVYFRDRHHLVLRVVEHIGNDLMTVSGAWFQGDGDGPREVRVALEGVVEVFHGHGPVLQALADAAADDPEVETVYGSLVQRFVDVTREHIEKETAAGRMLAVSDPDATARALIFMNEQYLLYAFGRPRELPSRTVVDTLATIWTRTLYGDGA